MLAATNAVTAESTSKSARSVAMALYVIGYPVGGVIGGLAAQSWLLVDYDWRAVFLFGAVVTAVMIPLVASARAGDPLSRRTPSGGSAR